MLGLRRAYGRCESSREQGKDGVSEPSVDGGGSSLGRIHHPLHRRSAAEVHTGIVRPSVRCFWLMDGQGCKKQNGVKVTALSRDGEEGCSSSSLAVVNLVIVCAVK